MAAAWAWGAGGEGDRTTGGGSTGSGMRRAAMAGERG